MHDPKIRAVRIARSPRMVETFRDGDAELDDDRAREAELQELEVSPDRAERLAFDVLHDDERHAVHPHHAVDIDHVGVIERPADPRLPHERFFTLRVAGFRENLEGDLLAEAVPAFVQSKPDLPVRAGAELLLETKLVEAFSGPEFSLGSHHAAAY